MSAVVILILVLGLLGSAAFLVAFVRGIREAIDEHRDPKPEPERTGNTHDASSSFFAALASAVVIGLVGVNPSLVYVGPVLAVAAALGVGQLLPGRQQEPRHDLRTAKRARIL
jgi:hypothetical protein